jgi:hypothetical protein
MLNSFLIEIMIMDMNDLMSNDNCIYVCVCIYI